MTDPGFADRTYLEPLDCESVAAVLRRDRPDALLPTMGGQTALNLARELDEAGVLAELGVELIGANVDAIARAEDRELFKAAVESCGLRVPTSRIVTSPEALDGVGLPAVVRPAFTLGGHGGGFVSTAEQLHRQVERGLAESPIRQVLVEESVRGWDEFELEVVRDRADNVVIVCSIENLDPMGVHTGDSVTVAPQMTLSDEAYQELRDAAVAVIRAVGVDTGGSNIQFARERRTGELRVIEMNPRVSRSSALASKATGYPIAKVAAKLAVGYTLDEIPNDLTGTTPASFEPTLDYVVVKWPRFAFEKFPGADATLGTQMKSVGESMGIGRTFAEAFTKARRGLDTEQRWEPENLHPWFAAELAALDEPAGATVYRRVDSCAGEVEARSNYFYSTRGERDEATPGPGRSVVILGSGPNRIGQGIEFDYCCVHAAKSFRAQGYETVMVNCNPETVSTDYDTSDRLYFEPLDADSVLAVLAREQPVGVCIQFGGQTPLKLARAIERAGFRILGTPYDAVDVAEDRARFARLAESVGVRCPEWGIAESTGDAIEIADRLGYPVLVRPSYVLGGRAMRVCYSADDVRSALAAVHAEGDVAVQQHHADTAPREAPGGDVAVQLRHSVLIDRFLENAIELDVDALCDGAETYVAAVMEHVEEAGIHSGDSSCVLPAPSDDERVREIVRRLGQALGVIGLLNVQLAIHAGEVYVLEVNPRASRTVPFASKATGVNLVDAACRLAAGARLGELALPPEGIPEGHHVKAAVLPFARFPGADPVLGPEMRSTGEVMASAGDFASAFAKAERAAGRRLPTGGRAFLSVRDRDKEAVLPIARDLVALGFELVATTGTAIALADADVPVSLVEKGEPVVHLVRRRGVDLVINTPEGRNARTDGYAIREAAVVARVPCITTLAVARAAVEAIANALAEPARTLQERHAEARAS
jgi:carbamoyl-phosphate synthase large subunit